MCATGIKKFFFWDLTTGCNVILMLSWMLQIRHLLVAILIEEVSFATSLFLVILGSIHSLTIFLAFIGSFHDISCLLRPQLIYQTVWFLYKQVAKFITIIDQNNDSYSTGLLHVADYFMISVSSYLGLTLVIYNRYKEIKKIENKMILLK